MSTNLDRYYTLLKAIDAERRHDEAFYRNLNQSKTIKEKVEGGFTWYPIKIVKKSYSIGEYVEVEIEKSSDTDRHHKFSEGVAVTLFNIQKDRIDFKGMVSGLRKDKMRILLHQDIMDRLDIFDHGLSGVELFYDDRTYKVMESALKEVMVSQKENIKTIRDALVHGVLAYDPISKEADNIFLLPHLNASQMSAIHITSQAPYLGIIHGPPGTGKTTTLVGLVQKLLQNEKRILVCAASNNAVDLLARRLSERGIRVLRVGNITRIHDDIAHLTIEEKVRNHAEWVHIKKVKIQAEELSKKASQFKRTFGPEERDERKALRKEARDLRQWAYELEDRLTDEIKHGVEVIATTLIGVSNRLLEDMRFSTVIIDEASQSLEAECWNAILKADRVILAGDHKQLPPTVKSTEAMKLGLETTILDVMTGKTAYSCMLNVQYRMNNSILNFSNARYYEGLLHSDKTVENRTLRDDKHPLVFIDTAGCGFDEELHAERLSYANPGEYFILREHLIMHYEKLVGASIGIISPYAEQVRYIRQELAGDESTAHLNIEVNTIDGFQGQEKEVIYISLVRSNEHGVIGFVKDERRLNVAMTRAQKKLVIIGDSATLAQNSLFSDVMAHIEADGHYDSAWNYMSY